MVSFSARQAAQYCGVSEKTMRRWIESGVIAAERSPEDQRAYLIDQDVLDASGRVRQIAPIADTENETGAALAVQADTPRGMTRADLDAWVVGLQDVHAADRLRAEKAEADAQQWAEQAGEWKTRATLLAKSVEDLQDELVAERLAATTRSLQPWWRRLLGL